MTSMCSTQSSLGTWSPPAQLIGRDYTGFQKSIRSPFNFSGLSPARACLPTHDSCISGWRMLLSVPLLGIQNILMQHTNHPMAKYCMTMISKDPTVSESAEI